MRICFLVITYALSVAPGFAQLHLLTGSPFSEGPAVYPSAILRVGDDGSVKKVQDIIVPPLGTEWIGVWVRDVEMPECGRLVLRVEC